MSRSLRFLLAAGTAVVLALAPAAGAAGDAPGVSAQDLACLKCHDSKGFSTRLPDGTSRPLHVATDAFAASVHREVGCAACHSETNDDCLKKKDRPRPFKSRREHSIAQMQACADCHGGVVQGYQESVHAALVKKDVESGAPVCTDCHGAHTERFFEAANKCEACHAQALEQHRDWLPKAERHLETVACEACHAPGAARRVNLRLYEGAVPLAVSAGVPQFEKMESAAGKASAGLDARAVWGLLKEFNRPGSDTRTALRGRLEVSSLEQGHRLAAKAKAIKDCSTCHRQGSEAFRSVSISIVGPDGKTVHAPADQEILNSIASLESVGGFYVIGASRIKLLDTLLLVVFIGGTAGPLAHLAFRVIARRIREKREARARREASGR